MSTDISICAVSKELMTIFKKEQTQKQEMIKLYGKEGVELYDRIGARISNDLDKLDSWFSLQEIPFLSYIKDDYLEENECFKENQEMLDKVMSYGKDMIEFSNYIDSDAYQYNTNNLTKTLWNIASLGFFNKVTGVTIQELLNKDIDLMYGSFTEITYEESDKILNTFYKNDDFTGNTKKAFNQLIEEDKYKDYVLTMQIM